ncbi:TPA: YSIRK-type signal peptide-containing protein, partial [Streptococcus pyogenes]|nr:YSIRK-type signal peptide-containing protein [Streptococcus pyogenes]HER1329704.1 YSIRK-type signal peptide-containing protein [Streptococcus pyogenes]
MVRKDTNRHYSLRKLKKGTASVAVALSVLGAGLAVNQTEVSAKAVTRGTVSDPETARQTIDKYDIKNHQLTQENEKLTQENEKLTKDKEELTQENEKLTKDKEELTKDKEELSKQKETLGLALDKTIDEKIKSDNDHKKEIGELKGSNKISEASRQG